ncbi:MAG: DUF1207 domain-containing protein [Simkaniaceae bacterium]|nr:DUF1207 domain-containing protein [Simkaniaceae bacterium]
MKLKHILLLICLTVVCADEQQTTPAQRSQNRQEQTESEPQPKRMSLSRRDSVNYGAEEPDDFYLEGYIQSLVDTHYYELNVLVYVKEGEVYLYNLPNNRLISNSIIAFVEDVPGIKKVHVTDKFPDKEVEILEKNEVRSQIKGIWFPQSTILYVPPVAAPREPRYSLGMRWGDSVLGTPAVEFSLGDIFPIFRWTNVWAPGGDLQLDIIGMMWAVFKMWGDFPNDECSELVTTDYMGAITLSYAFDNWSFRARIYHVSSHLGDEFMFNNPQVPRVNPSFEAIDFFTSYQVTDGFNLVGGPGFILNSDNSFPMKTFYFEWGGELRILGQRFFYHKLYGSPFLSMYFRNWQVNNYHLDSTFALGYEWSKMQGVGRKFRIYGEYHNGYSEGQFFTCSGDYFALKVSYGF